MTQHTASQKSSLSLNLRYMAMQLPYWMGFSILSSFASVFLLSRHLSDGQIGVVLAAGNLLAVLLQPLAASLADRSVRFTLSQFTAILALVMVLTAVLLAFLPAAASGAILYAFLYTVLMVLQPLTISLGTFYILRGQPLNFGLARGMGSLAFAAASALGGWLIDRTGANAVPFMVIACFSLFFFSLFGLPTGREAVTAGPEDGTCVSSEKPCSLPEFFRSYKRFILLLTGVSLLFTYHNILNTYLYQIMEPLGGTAGDVGVCLSIAAVCELPTMFLFAWLYKRFRCSSLMRTAALFFTLKSLVILLADHIWLINLAQCLQIFAFALHTAASVYYTNQVIPPKDQVKGQALMTTANTAGGVLGTFLGGQLLLVWGVSNMLLTGTLLSALGTVIVFLSAENRQTVKK